MIYKRLLHFFLPWRYRESQQEVVTSFRVRYDRFKELLDANTELAWIIGDIEEKIQGNQIFGLTYVRNRVTRALHHTRRMIDSLNEISDHKYPRLVPVLEAIEKSIQAELGEIQPRTLTDWILPYTKVTRDVVDFVGSKNSNLGEVFNRLGMRVPEGFAITNKACEHVFVTNRLDEVIRTKLEQEDTSPETLNAISEEIQTLMLSALIPDDLAEQILFAYDAMVVEVRQSDPEYDGMVSVRSSAVGEDTAMTHAGQYLTLLNVPREQLLEAYRQVISSLFSPWAMSYRINQGTGTEDLAMPVACLCMIRARSSGVMFSRQPLHPENDVVTISAVLGLGPTAVNGSITPDLFLISRNQSAKVEARVVDKPTEMRAVVGGGVEDVDVSTERRQLPSLSDAEASELATMALRLESHFDAPQDSEWAVDASGRCYLLQTRPLRIERLPSVRHPTSPCAFGHDYPLLLERGVTAFPGVAYGPVVIARPTDELRNLPEGSVLVTHHPSPMFVLAMPKTAAIITDLGSALGHMASLCREFRIPTLVDTRAATERLRPGQWVTVDAYSGRVYEGRVPELLALQAASRVKKPQSLPAMTLERVAEFIVPLRLIDPRAPTFTPQSCKSLHDIMRFVHESSYVAMFHISDRLSSSEGGAVKLDAPIPLDLYLIDLGGGLNEGQARRVTVEHIASIPFKALLDGMLCEELRTPMPRHISVGGFLSVMSEQMFTQPYRAGERFGDRSYAIISDRYLHFSSRIGYHYSILDVYCDEMVRKSHITFSFQGGAADEVRRGRRAKAISIVLKAHGFSVDNKADRVTARLKRSEAKVMFEKLEMLGRLLQFTRQLDMLMDTENRVMAVANAFLSGKYHLEGELV